MGKAKNKVYAMWDKPPIKAKNQKQTKYLNLLNNHNVIWAIGPSGTGKTFLPACKAADLLQDPRSAVERVIIARPAEGPGTSIGFLKGGLYEKMKPWVAPVTEAMATRYGKGLEGKRHVERLIEEGKIELLPTEHSRGLTWNNAFVIVDEIQNLDWETLKNLTLRIGQDCTVVFCGDIKQKDIVGHSGLSTIMYLLENYHTPWSMIEFEIEDNARSGISKYTLELYEEANL